MPIIKSAKKAVKQNEVKRLRNYRTRRQLHDVQKDFYKLVKETKKDEAVALLAKVYKTIDTAAKKRVIPVNRASRLKAKAARGLAGMQ
jgi:small subunit ribosomal protein S20